MEYSIESRTLTQQPTAARRATLPAGQVGPWLADSYSRVAAYLERTGTPMSGPPYARYRFRDHEMEVEAGFPVTRPIAGDGPILASALPGGLVAVTTHYGRYEDLDKAHKAIMDWMERHGWQPAGGHWEVYFTSPAEEPDSSRWRTDVVAPYTRKVT
jgi:effector-binding domain-containing protein